jgi:hypothetical protein
MSEQGGFRFYFMILHFRTRHTGRTFLHGLSRSDSVLDSQESKVH